ncbi:FAD-binding protein [uncultured Adlercreutzia sp.]|uniref:FAD-binding protein n=1 Tax=uncultured Adlercreutzia sp. TaxID=875803 RepID=UPI0025FB1501|nr:FAD-binding protein [uncultured Adlercreutzia sp.]MCI9261225.1 FAD-binding protein [Eggerthellaceae bacterium]
METNLDRRGFLKGAALGTAGLVAAGALAGCSQPAAAPAEKDNAALADTSTPSAGYNSADQQWAFEVAPEAIADDQITGTEEADVVVVGGGMAGMVSAASCAENGLKVILISASTGPVSRGGSNNGVYSKVMKDMGIERMDPTWFYRMQYAANGGNFKPALWYKFYNHSEEAINWIIDIAANAGIKTTIESGPMYKEGDPMYTPTAAHAFYVDDEELHGAIGNGEGYIAAELGRYLTEDLGVDVRWGVKAEQLVRGGVPNGTEGRVDAVLATDGANGYTKYVGTKAVIMATGDFSHDKDMMEKYCPQAVELCDFTTEVNYDQGIWMGGLMPGDGHKMELWVGGAWQKEPNNIMLGRPNLPGDQPYTSHTGLMVDNQGQRFMNEDVLGGFACATIMHLPEKTGYCIWGQNRAEAGGPWGAINYAHGEYFTTQEVIDRWDNDTDGFNIVKADTREEVIAQLGLPAETIETIERYNEMCAKGEDTDFYKTADKLIPIGEGDGPFYGAAFTPGFLTSLGGLRNDEHLRVLDANDQPIEGLYNAGCMIGNFYSATYTFAMEGMNYGACCITLPYVLGQELASGELDA